MVKQYKFCSKCVQKDNKGSNYSEKKENGQFNWNSMEELATLSRENLSLKEELKLKTVENKKYNIIIIHIFRLKIMVETNTPITGIDPSKLESNGQDIRDAKILELAKKVQKQNVTIESQKTKIKNLEEEIKLRKQIHETKMSEEIGLTSPPTNTKANTKTSTNAPNPTDQSNQIKQLLKDVNSLRMKLTTCEGEIKKYKLLLQREIGDNVKISDVIDNESEWKGRQEIIMSLQVKIKKLESQSSNKISNERYINNILFYLFRAEKALNGIEKEKKMKVQELTEKCQTLEEANNTYKSNSIYQ